MISFASEPYYDDFDETKNFHKILFKPGYAVQARELTQLQSIIQNQIDKFGSHVFKDGSVVHDGEHSPLAVHAIAIKSFTGTSDLSFFVDKIVYVGDVRKKVVYTETLDAIPYLFVTDASSGNILENSTLLVENYSTYELLVESSTTTIVYRESILHTIKSGIYFVNGVFAKIEEQTIVVSLSDAKASVDVYMVVRESIVTSGDDESLLDNSFGTPNYLAPGSDRYAIALTLVKTLPGVGITTNDKHFLLSSYRNGSTIKNVNKPDYSDLEKHLADRTFKESGNYTVKPFIGSIINHNFDDTKVVFKLDSGDAFINGYEVSTEAPTSLDVDKARTTTLLNNSQVTIDKGPYILVENLTGLIFPYTTTTIDIHSSISPSTSSATYESTKIGTATVFGTTFDSINTGTTNTYKLFIRNIVLNSGKTIGSARSFIIKTGSGPYTWSFYAQYSTESYDRLTILGATVTDVLVLNSQNYNQLFKLLNTPVKTHINTNTGTTDISYQYYKEFLSTTFARTSGSSSGSFTLSGSQFFIGSGLVPTITVAQQWYAVVRAVGAGTGTAPVVGSIIKLESGTVSIVSNTSALVTLPIDYNLTLDVFVVIGESIANTRNKVLHEVSTLTVSGLNLSASFISLLKADGKQLISVIDNLNVDHTSKYTFHTGQQDAYYDHAFIKLVSSTNTPARSNPQATSLTISFDYYSHTGLGPLTVDSYNGLVSYEEIISYRMANGEILRLSDVLDFRPRRTDGATTLLFDAYKKPYFGSYLVTDYEYYLPRIDKAVILASTKELSIIKGIPAKFPLVPDTGEAMTLYVLSIPAYTFNYNDVTSEYVDNKRYTMRDIAKIDKRVNRLEYYASLSLLEKQATDESTPSDVPGIDKFKNGILVDSFAGHSVGDVFNPHYKCAIDMKQRYLRPSYLSDTFDYVIDANASTNVLINNDHAILHFDNEVAVISQTEASETTSVQPFAVFNWNGIMSMDPPADIWVDTTNSARSVVNLNGEFDHLSQAAAGGGTVWSDWAVTGVGITDLVLSSSVSVQSQVNVA